MTIQTIDELLDFIETNFEKLSNKAYIDICRTTMHLYEYRKPDTKEAAIKRITELYSFSLNYQSVQDMPLFLD
jgi:hypothetical protein